MNAHNEQQPAAAQEAVRKPDGYHYRYPTLYGTGTCIRQNNGEEVNGSKPIEAVPYWYAPVTAAPAVAYMVDGRVEQGLTFDKAAAETMALANAGTVRPLGFVDGTPAAPGIDLQSIRKVAMPILCPMLCARNAESVVRKLHAALIDASPKGGSGCRYFCGGPEGHFFCDDLKLARDLVNAYDKGDDWTITDLQASDAEVRP